MNRDKVYSLGINKHTVYYCLEHNNRDNSKMLRKTTIETKMGGKKSFG